MAMTQNVPHALVVLGDLRIIVVVDELVAWVDIGTCQRSPRCRFYRPRSPSWPRWCSLCMAWSKMRNEHCTAKPHFVAIMQHAIDFVGG